MYSLPNGIYPRILSCTQRTRTKMVAQRPILNQIGRANRIGMEGMGLDEFGCATNFSPELLPCALKAPSRLVQRCERRNCKIEASQTLLHTCIFWHDKIGLVIQTAIADGHEVLLNTWMMRRRHANEVVALWTLCQIVHNIFQEFQQTRCVEHVRLLKHKMRP